MPRQNNQLRTGAYGVGAIIYAQLKAQNLTVKQLGRLTNRTGSSISQLLGNAHGMRSIYIMEFSRILQYNIFQHLANLLPTDWPPAPASSPEQAQAVEALRQERDQLKQELLEKTIENKTLRETIQLMTKHR